jgi:ABC-2 type transport system permease protein
MMKTTLTHELYKMAHQHSSWLAFILLFGLMIYSAIPIAYINKALVAQGFGAGQWVIIIMIALSANLVAMEFRNNTMTTLLYKSPNRQSVFLAKLVTLILYSLLLLLASFVFALIIKLLFVNSKFSWGFVYHQHPLITDLVINLAGVALYLMFSITLSLMLISMIKSSAVVIVIGLFVGFLGAPISAFMLNTLPGLANILAWNPFNMINIIQLADPSIHQISMLTNGELIAGNLIYTLLFLLIGLWAFKKQNF